VNLFKLIWLTAIHLPENLANLFKHRQERMVLNELEAERLDRIRHPEKYRGK
jgi:hypothetical protein